MFIVYDCFHIPQSRYCYVYYNHEENDICTSVFFFILHPIRSYYLVVPAYYISNEGRICLTPYRDVMVAKSNNSSGVSKTDRYL